MQKWQKWYKILLKLNLFSVWWSALPNAPPPPARTELFNDLNVPVVRKMRRDLMILWVGGRDQVFPNTEDWSPREVTSHSSLNPSQAASFWFYLLDSRLESDSSPNHVTRVHTSEIYSVQRGYFYFQQFFMKDKFEIKTYLSAPKYIFAYIIHRLQTVWNQTKWKKLILIILTILVHILFCSFCFLLNKHCSPTNTNYI